MHDEAPRHQTLATSDGLGSITVCPCGTLSLHFGGISLRMDLSAFVQTAEMFRNAVTELESRARWLEQAGGIVQ